MEKSSMHKLDIKPLHFGFGFGADEILKRSLKKTVDHENILSESETVTLKEHPDNSLMDSMTAVDKKSFSTAVIESVTSHDANQSNANNVQQIQNNIPNTRYYVHPFFAFLAWTVDAFFGFCFLVISICFNYFFLPKGFFEISPFFLKYLIFLNFDTNIAYTFLFSLQVWFLMALLVFVFQYTILGFEGATLGRWIFGVTIQNHKNRLAKISEKIKIFAALSEAMLLGSILSFIFIIIFPSRVPIFFWLRYSTKI
jgi:hypothetical protein